MHCVSCNVSPKFSTPPLWHSLQVREAPHQHCRAHLPVLPVRRGRHRGCRPVQAAVQDGPLQHPQGDPFRLQVGQVLRRALNGGRRVPSGWHSIAAPSNGALVGARWRGWGLSVGNIRLSRWNSWCRRVNTNACVLAVPVRVFVVVVAAGF